MFNTSLPSRREVEVEFDTLSIRQTGIPKDAYTPRESEFRSQLAHRDAQLCSALDTIYSLQNNVNRLVRVSEIISRQRDSLKKANCKFIRVIRTLQRQRKSYLNIIKNLGQRIKFSSGNQVNLERKLV